MDDRNGQLYASKDEALEAGVPLEHIKQVKRIMTGPFRGRVYEVLKNGRLGRRIKPVKETPDVD